MQAILHHPVMLLWIDLVWIFFVLLLIFLAAIFYFLNRKNKINQAFALLLLVIAYFGAISTLVISFQAVAAHWSILLMPVLCYLGLVFHMFVKAVLGAARLFEKGERRYFYAGFVFAGYVLFQFIYPGQYQYLRETSKVIDHALYRAYTREPVYVLYMIYMVLPILYAGARLVRAVRAPDIQEREVRSLARIILWIFSFSIFWALLALAVPPMFGKPQLPALGSLALIASVIAYSWTLLRHRAWRIEVLTEKLRLREAQLSERNRMIETDLDLARAIHRKILPDLLLAGKEFECTLFYEPIEKVGGDFYDLTRAGDKLRVIIADVSGHGVAAGLFSAMSSLLLRSVWSDATRSLSDIAGFLNDQLTGYSVNGIFVSALIAEYDIMSGDASIINAGHPSAFCISANGLSELSGSGRLLGVTTGNNFKAVKFRFERGDTLFFYTDGLIEATNTTGDEFGSDRLRELLDNTRTLNPGPRERRVVRELASFHGPRSYEDDLTILQIRKR